MGKGRVGRNDFEAGKSNFEGHWKAWALKIEIFLGSVMATSEASAIRAQKSRVEKKAGMFGIYNIPSVRYVLYSGIKFVLSPHHPYPLPSGTK